MRERKTLRFCRMTVAPHVPWDGLVDGLHGASLKDSRIGNAEVLELANCITLGSGKLSTSYHFGRGPKTKSTATFADWPSVGVRRSTCV